MKGHAFLPSTSTKLIHRVILPATNWYTFLTIHHWKEFRATVSLVSLDRVLGGKGRGEYRHTNNIMSCLRHKEVCDDWKVTAADLWAFRPISRIPRGAYRSSPFPAHPFKPLFFFFYPLAPSARKRPLRAVYPIDSHLMKHPFQR